MQSQNGIFPEVISQQRLRNIVKYLGLVGCHSITVTYSNYNYKHSQQNIMNFHFHAIKRVCCPNEIEMHEEKIQEQQAQSFQTQRQLSPTHTTRQQTLKIKESLSNYHQSFSSQLRDFREPQNNRNVMTSKEYKQPQIDQINSVKFSFQNKGFGSIHLNNSESSVGMQIYQPPRLSSLTQPTSNIFFVNQYKNTNQQSARANSPKVTFTHLSHQQQLKTQSKSLKTQEQETEYSSKQSLIAFRNYNTTSNPIQIPSLMTFEKNNSIFFQNKAIFQQQNYSFDNNDSLNCKQVSARFQIDHSFNADLLNNARTIQSIVTSNQIKSRFNSRMPSNAQDKKSSLLLFTPINSKQFINQGLKESQTYRKNSPQHFRNYHSPLMSAQRSISPPPSLNVSPRVQELTLSTNVQSNLFYGSNVAKKMRKSPKVSVLELNQSKENEYSSEAEELRDVIDNNYLQSQYCSHSNSPISSINHSLKNLSQEKQRKAVSFFKITPQHSRQSSNELQLFKQTMAKLRRTNTIESIESHSSENSCIDIKFMQRMRGRREVSHLL